jgi:hypothetical protein
LHGWLAPKQRTFKLLGILFSFPLRGERRLCGGKKIAAAQFFATNLVMMR